MTTPSASEPASLSGTTLILAGVVLALTNFMVVLDTTIANVSVAHIAGGLGISSSEGTGSSHPMPWPKRFACR